MNLFLSPLAALYNLFASIRNFLYDKRILPSYKSSIPVICVGNLTAGGNGKTPFTIWLASALAERGKRVAILSRGYGGRIRDVHEVQSEDQADEVGDEPLMMAQAGMRVFVSPDRVAGMKAIENADVDIVIMDDGYQHRRLERDVNLVCMNAQCEEAIKAFELGRLLPLGMFRESLAQGLNRCDAVILNSRSPKPIERDVELSVKLPTFSTRFAEIQIVDVKSREEPPPSKEVYALCALGNSGAFFQSIESAGYTIMERISLSDHSRALEKSLRSIRKDSSNPVICTEKDLVKIPQDLFENLYVLLFQLKVDNGDELVQYCWDRLYESLYQEIILRHYRDPVGYVKQLPEGALQSSVENTLCGDAIQLRIELVSERVSSVAFSGDGCALSQAAGSLFCELSVGKTFEELDSFYDELKKFVEEEEEYVPQQDLGDFCCFAIIRSFSGRRKCIELIWSAYERIKGNR